MTTLVLPFEVNGVALTIDYAILPTANASEYAVTARVNLTPDSQQRKVVNCEASAAWRYVNADYVILGVNESLDNVWIFGDISLHILLDVIHTSYKDVPRHTYHVVMLNKKANQTYMRSVGRFTDMQDKGVINLDDAVFLQTVDTFAELQKGFKGDVAVTLHGEDGADVMTDKLALGVTLSSESLTELLDGFSYVKRMTAEAEKYDLDHTGMVQWRLEQIQATIEKLEYTILN